MNGAAQLRSDSLTMAYRLSVKLLPAAVFASAILSGCGGRDPNDRPIYGKSGLPVNCRAYVQTAINGYRSNQYTADEAMNGLERNCGIVGHAWGATD
jgi:hypothetical protein